MIRLHEAKVAAHEIDNLGHMNIRFYSARAAAAMSALFAHGELDQGEIDPHGLVMIHQDSFVRYLREQFEGAPLVVRGGFVSADRKDVTIYLELVNDDDGRCAACFIVKPALYQKATRARVGFPEAVIERAEVEHVDLPSHGSPRTLKLSPPRQDLDFAELDRRLSGSQVRPAWPVLQRACDEYGYMNITDAQDIMMSVMRHVSGPQGVPVLRGDRGERIGWALLENRQFLVATPQAGERVKTLSAQVHIGVKTQQTRHWTFNVGTGALLSIVDSVALALDLEARRSTEIPAEIRQQLQAQYYPELI